MVNATRCWKAVSFHTWAAQIETSGVGSTMMWFGLWRDQAADGCACTASACQDSTVCTSIRDCAIMFRSILHHVGVVVLVLCSRCHAINLLFRIREARESCNTSVGQWPSQLSRCLCSSYEAFAPQVCDLKHQNRGQSLAPYDSGPGPHVYCAHTALIQKAGSHEQTKVLQRF